jgi:two-component system, NtrC family, nitrogen regulation response regulator GlnG
MRAASVRDQHARPGSQTPRWRGVSPQAMTTAFHSRSAPLVCEGPARRILIADDEPAIRDILVECVKQSKHGQGYAVSTASDGSAALEAITRERPDLILLDHNMPGMTGLEVLKQIHQIDPSIRIVMITGTMNDGDAAEALKRGAFSYVPKPFDLQYIDALIALALPPVQVKP